MPVRIIKNEYSNDKDKKLLSTIETTFGAEEKYVHHIVERPSYASPIYYQKPNGTYLLEWSYCPVQTRIDLAKSGCKIVTKGEMERSLGIPQEDDDDKYDECVYYQKPDGSFHYKKLFDNNCDEIPRIIMKDRLMRKGYKIVTKREIERNQREEGLLR